MDGIVSFIGLGRFYENHEDLYGFVNEENENWGTFLEVAYPRFATLDGIPMPFTTKEFVDAVSTNTSLRGRAETYKTPLEIPPEDVRINMNKSLMESAPEELRNTIAKHTETAARPVGWILQKKKNKRFQAEGEITEVNSGWTT